MECEDDDNSGAVNASAVNSLIIDYYKKFGRKRDLEQYFSLSTAQGEVRDPTGLFWRQMKSQSDSSDSGGKQSSSPQELCRILIKCTVPDPSSSQDENTGTKSESVSPPIITEDVVVDTSRHTDDESAKSDNGSQKCKFSTKALDALLDSSMNKPLSPTSSVTSQRKLEWDSLADVGYANESDRKNSASSLSTLERLALKQQYSYNDTKQEIGPPTDHSTPLDQNEATSKSKKVVVKKTTKFYKKDIDFVKVNVPHNSETNPSQAINFNLTKHISFSVEKDGGVIIEDIKKDVTMSPEKVSVETELTPQLRIDKQIQTSLSKEKSLSDKPRTDQICNPRIPVIIALNTLKKRHRRKKLRHARRTLRSKKKAHIEKDNFPAQERSGGQLSEAESFEYMPGHIYNQNHMKANESRPINIAGNKSSLESSGVLTTDSSKGSKHSFTKDLEKSIDLLKAALQQRYDDENLKKKLVKEVIQRLLKSKYRDDDSSTDFLSGLSFNSKKIDLGVENTTTSTSDGNNTTDKFKLTRPKKSILRVDKFNANPVASTSQSAPNLPAVVSSDKPFTSKLMKIITSPNTDSDISSKEKNSSDNAFAKTTSEEIYQKYLEALRREEAYKRRLREKDKFLKQKLTCSDSAFKVPVQPDVKINKRIKDLMKDLTRNNYDDGSGDASKLEGGSNSYMEFEKYKPTRSERSHSVFTLSSGNSEAQCRKSNFKKRLQNDIKDLSKPSSSKDGYHYCCCQQHSANIKIGVTDSSVQVNIKDQLGTSSIEPDKGKPTMTCKCQRCSVASPRDMARLVSDDVTGDIKYVCLSNEKAVMSQEVSDNFLIYKCSRLTNKGVQLEDEPSRASYTIGVQCANVCTSHENDNARLLHSASEKDKIMNKNLNEIFVESQSSCSENIKTISQSSQTNLMLKMLRQKSSATRSTISSPNPPIDFRNSKIESQYGKQLIHEATRCIQTEISINPQISDPSLSDINIVNNLDCVKLISEQFKEVSKRSSETDVHTHKAQSNDETQPNYKTCKNAISEDNIGQVCEDVKISCDVNTKSVNEEIKSDIDTRSHTDIMQHTESFADNFTIPIQGTNMTLMVSIGSNEPITSADRKIDEGLKQGAAIEDSDFAVQSTSTIDEFSENVRYQSSKFNSEQNVDHNSNEIMNHSTDLKNACQVNTCLTSCEPKFNTYPKNSLVNNKKPLLRSNTDTKKLENCCIQIDNIDKADMTTQQMFECNFIKPIQKPLRSGGSENFGDRNITEDKRNNLTGKRDKGTQKDLQEKNYISEASVNDPQKCTCGCSTPSNCMGTCDQKSTYIKEATYQSSIPSPSYIHNASENLTERNIARRKQNNLIDMKDMGTQKDLQDKTQIDEVSANDQKKCVCGCLTPLKCLGNCKQNIDDKNEFTRKSSHPSPSSDRRESQPQSKIVSDAEGTLNKDSQSSSDSEKQINTGSFKDPILAIIKDITKRYSKSNVEKNKNKKCFKDIVTVLNHLLDTDESTDRELIKDSGSSNTDCDKGPIKTELQRKPQEKVTECFKTKTLVDKGVQLSFKEPKNTGCIMESSELPTSTDLPTTSSDSATCKVLTKIKKECDKYHQKRCKSHGAKKCEASSSTSVNCEQCRRVHHCPCRFHKCKGHKSKPHMDKCQKRSVAYNLIVQTSESMICEETPCGKDRRPLQNIVVKVPSKRMMQNIPFKEMEAKIEKKLPQCNPGCETKCHKSRSMPNESEISSVDECTRRAQACTVRDYLERNRPDFVEKSSHRQNCMKLIGESRASERAAHRELLSTLVAGQSPLSSLNLEELRHLAKEIGVDPARKKRASKFISEREMKKHSEKIYKSLPEVVQKKEEVKKENIKKTNLLMANMFRKNLQRNTLRGAVNLSNYSTVIKI